ncbi:hypothetical protein RF11_15796 [Thelohanellus kitauei]|uniref:Uncharacterized protein n=1 Tax=Thelohanellus kitauei TaxID=669202 RepID=A0A0C2JA17_THEKT|nr:hypothetical protein RF11_15796 [Thelohanellus kitauei]
MEMLVPMRIDEATDSGCKNQSKDVKYEEKIYCVLFESDTNENWKIVCNPSIDKAIYEKLNILVSQEQFKDEFDQLDSTEESDTESLPDNPYPGSDSHQANQVYCDTYQFGNLPKNCKPLYN